jgi:hypothetical protein
MDQVRRLEPDLQVPVRLDVIRGMTLADAAMDILAYLDTEADWWGNGNHCEFCGASSRECYSHVQQTRLWCCPDCEHPADGELLDPDILGSGGLPLSASASLRRRGRPDRPCRRSLIAAWP